jgi:hypothetical protein
VVFGDPLVAAAISTEAFAVRKMDIERDSFRFSKVLIGLFDQTDPTPFIEVVGPKRYGGIGGIAWCGDVVFLKKSRGNSRHSIKYFYKFLFFGKGIS